MGGGVGEWWSYDLDVYVNYVIRGGIETKKKLLLTNSFIRAFREQITRSGLLVLQKHI